MRESRGGQGSTCPTPQFTDAGSPSVTFARSISEGSPAPFGRAGVTPTFPTAHLRGAGLCGQTQLVPACRILDPPRGLWKSARLASDRWPLSHVLVSDCESQSLGPGVQDRPSVHEILVPLWLLFVEV